MTLPRRFPARPSGTSVLHACARAAGLACAWLAAAAAPSEAVSQCRSPATAGQAGAYHQEGLHEVALGALDPGARQQALSILNSSPCTCGCRHTLASCRVADAGCDSSRALAHEVVRRTQAGEDESQVRAYLRAQPVLPPAHRQARPQPAVRSRPPGDTRPPAADGLVLDERVYDIPIDGAPTRGPEGASVTIVEFSDFQCPFCAQSQPLLDELLNAHMADVRLVFKHFPLPSHLNARGAALAALAAQEQGQFWAMHDLLFTNRSSLERPSLVLMARKLGLDLERFESDMDSAPLQERLERDLAHGRAAELTGTPMFYVNGRKLRAASREGLRRAVAEARAAMGREKPAGAPVEGSE